MLNDYKRKSVSRGMSLPSVLLLVFIILKLAGVITWSWLWVLSPLWIGVSLGVVFFIVIGLILLTAIVGTANENSRAIMGIKSWLRRKDCEEEKHHSDED